jgi:hypothetical protein
VAISIETGNAQTYKTVHDMQDLLYIRQQQFLHLKCWTICKTNSGGWPNESPQAVLHQNYKYCGICAQSKNCGVTTTQWHINNNTRLVSFAQPMAMAAHATVETSCHR